MKRHTPVRPARISGTRRADRCGLAAAPAGVAKCARKRGQVQPREEHDQGNDNAAGGRTVGSARAGQRHRHPGRKDLRHLRRLRARRHERHPEVWRSRADGLQSTR
jgi:hypothetical protein